MTPDHTVPLLSLFFLTLPVGLLLAWLLPKPESAKRVALVVTALDFALSLAVLTVFDARQADFQLVVSAPWISSLNIQYLMGVDGLSVLFLPATLLLFLGVILASWNTVHNLPRLYYSLLMLLKTATLGIFLSLDTILFFMFWELSLIPLYFLVNLWGVGPNRRYAATKYTLVMMAGGVPLLFGFVVLAFNHLTQTGVWAFDLPSLLGTPLPTEGERLVFLLLLLGFAVKVPVFPMHTWLPVIASEGPVAVASLLLGLKLGAYGLIRFAVPLAPEAALELHWLLAGLGVIGILYGAVAALAQTNLRAMLAYSSLSHVGLVLLGIASFNLQGIQGAVMQLLNFTVVAGGLFLLAGFLHHRVGSNDIHSLGGAARSMPLLASFFLFFGLASMGVPGTNGFPAELLILLSAFKTHTGAGLAALFGMVVGAGYFIRLYRRAFFGPLTSPVVAQAVDLRRREFVIVLVFAAIVLIVGLYPALVLDVLQASGQLWVSRLQ